MKFKELCVEGAYVIEPTRRGDERGFFARIFCSQVFEEKGLNSQVAQINNSLSADKGTLRGLHYQLPPHEETKIVRCISGAVYDVVLDLRPSSPTYKQWAAQELSASNRLMMYVPQGCAHGFVTLEADTEIIYFVSEFYAPDLERGIRWDDPAFGITWPLNPQIISDKDRQHPNYESAHA